MFCGENAEISVLGEVTNENRSTSDGFSSRDLHLSGPPFPKLYSEGNDWKLLIPLQHCVCGLPATGQ